MGLSCTICMSLSLSEALRRTTASKSRVNKNFSLVNTEGTTLDDDGEEDMEVLVDFFNLGEDMEEDLQEHDTEP